MGRFDGAKETGEPVSPEQNPFILEPNQPRVFTGILAQDLDHYRYMMGVGPALGSGHEKIMWSMARSFPGLELLLGGEFYAVNTREQAGPASVLAVNNNSTFINNHEIGFDNNVRSFLALLSKARVLPFALSANVALTTHTEESPLFAEVLGTFAGAGNIRHDTNNVRAGFEMACQLFLMEFANGSFDKDREIDINTYCLFTFGTTDPNDISPNFIKMESVARLYSQETGDDEAYQIIRVFLSLLKGKTIKAETLICLCQRYLQEVRPRLRTYTSNPSPPIDVFEIKMAA